jgi:hypothetical protein
MHRIEIAIGREHVLEFHLQGGLFFNKEHGDVVFRPMCVVVADVEDSSPASEEHRREQEGGSRFKAFHF